VSKPELIVKHVYGWSEGYRLTFRPGFCLLGNRAGLEWLAGHLRARAARIDESAPYRPDDPDAVEDLWEAAPWNRLLSDELHLALGSYADGQRERTLPALNVTGASRLTGPPAEQWPRLLAEMASWLEGAMARAILAPEERERVAASFADLANAVTEVARRARGGVKFHDVSDDRSGKAE
jgi:hypothetical protein